MDQQWYEQTESVVKSVKKETAEKKIDRLIQNFKHFYPCKLMESYAHVRPSIQCVCFQGKEMKKL